MKQFLLLSSMLISLSLFSQVRIGAPGTVEQGDKDPAAQGVQKEREVKDFEEPERQEEELPTDEMEKSEEDNTPNFIEENEI